MQKTFSIDNINFNIDIPSDFSNFTVKSYMKEYDVEFNFENTPYDMLKLTYINGDFIIVDKKVYDIYFKNKGDIVLDKYLMVQEANEDIKNINTCMKLFDRIYENGFTKKNKLIVIGGGIIQDIGSFTAAIYKRGINWVFFPSTLLSMSDSCIGSKMGINHNKAKNQIGLFYPPSKVIITYKFLETLEKRELKSGFGEIIKLYATGGKYFFDNYITYNDFNELTSKDIIKCLYYSLLIKKQIIEYDEFELNIRKSLNYGHTFGHALEVLVDHKIPHGIAVAYGMLIINDYFGYENERFKELCLDLIQETQLDINISPDMLKDLIKNDKKTIGNEISLIYIEELGKTLFKKVKITDEFIEKITKLINKYLLK